MKVSRYPIVFNTDSVDLGGFVEQIAPGAVDRTLRGESDVVALFNHNADMPLGRVKAATLHLEKRSRGLLATVDVNEGVTFAADFLELLRRNDAPGGSFGFRAIDDVWSLRDGLPFRLVLDMAIREVSLGVAFPAYIDTQRAVQDAGPPATRRRSIALARRELQQLLVR